jgi:hypothetical protein
MLLTYRRTSSEVERLTYGQLRKVNIHLSLINTLPSKVLVHSVFRDSLIVDMRVLADIETLSLSRDGLQ